MAVCTVLTCAGIGLLYAGLHTPDPTANLRPQAPVVHAASPGASGSPLAADPAPSAPSPGGTPVPQPPHADAGTGGTAAPLPSGPVPSSTAASPAPSELPPPGSGEAADPLIQQALDRARAPDLPPATEKELLALGRAVWLAETSGYTRVRIQAATARRDTANPALVAGARPERVVVRLVWAGADPAGTFLDSRTATVHFTQNEEGSWNRTS